MDPPPSGRVTPWHPEDEFSQELMMKYFCGRIQPKLSKLKEFKDLELSYETQKNAIIELLKWRDDGTLKVSNEFREFYDGLLFFSNIHYLSLPRPLQELIDIFFEIHGSDPQNFPEAMKLSLRLFNQALTKLSPDWETKGLLAVLAEASSLGSQAADMLLISLEHYKRRLPAGALGDPYGKLMRGEPWMQLPFARGLGFCASQAQSSILEDIRARLTPEDNFQCQAQKEDSPTLENAASKAVDRGINAELLPPGSETDCFTQIFVGPSGCGKTSKIRSLLKRHWGFYLLPGNIPKESDEPTNRLEYKSRRGGGSRDTQTWFERVKSRQQLGLLSWEDPERQAGRVLGTRLWILEQFRALGPHRTPCDWLELQTNCRDPRNDVFNHIYRVTRLTWWDNLGPQRPFNSKLIFCFDETQCDLPEIPPGEMKWSSYSAKVRPLACMYLAAFKVNSRHNDPKNLRLFLSGTALQLRHMQRVIRSYAHSATQIMADKLSKATDVAPKVNHDFRLVNERNFGKLIHARKNHYDKEILEMVIQNSKLLHGRVLWSVCYLDAIDELIESQNNEQRKVLEKHVKEASERIYGMAKKGLKDRLEDMRRPRGVAQLSGFDEMYGTTRLMADQARGLQAIFDLNTLLENQTTDPEPFPEDQIPGLIDNLKIARKAAEGINLDLFEFASELKSLIDESEGANHPRAVDHRLQHDGLIDELCALAIRSDLLGEATIFKSRESEDLVAFGFAFLDETQDSRGSRVKLKERLAVDAVIEYFQHQKLSNGQSEYDRALINFLYSEQSNASALGKVAELFFAWHLKKVLGTCADMITPTVGDGYRKQVLGLLVGDAQTIDDLETRGTGSDLRSQIAHHSGDLSAFRLVEGKRTAYQEEVDEERTITMWDWLRNIRHGRHGDDLQSTFWFPSNNTGPDVLFALESETPETFGDSGGLDYSLVLCAVQIKREKRIGDVERAIATTNPNYWFSSNYPHHIRNAREITRELAYWQERYPIVRILVSALTGPSHYRNAEEKPTTAKKYFGETGLIIPTQQQYFTSIGAEYDDLLFGDAFRRLRKAQGIETTRERRGEA